MSAIEGYCHLLWIIMICFFLTFAQVGRWLHMLGSGYLLNFWFGEGTVWLLQLLQVVLPA